MKRATQYLLASIALFLLAGYADYELQAFQHGWNSFLDLSARAPKWGMLDFIPHDAWHIAQWLRNLAMICAPIFVMRWYARTFNTLGQPTYWRTGWKAWMEYHRAWMIFVAVLALYAMTRGLTFSLLYHVMR